MRPIALSQGASSLRPKRAPQAGPAFQSSLRTGNNREFFQLQAPFSGIFDLNFASNPNMLQTNFRACQEPGTFLARTHPRSNKTYNIGLFLVCQGASYVKVLRDDAASAMSVQLGKTCALPSVHLARLRLRRTRHASLGHSGARPQGRASASLRRPGMTSFSKLDTFAPSLVRQAELARRASIHPGRH
jgi:hypothetical protein